MNPTYTRVLGSQAVNAVRTPGVLHLMRSEAQILTTVHNTIPVKTRQQVTVLCWPRTPLQEYLRSNQILIDLVSNT